MIFRKVIGSLNLDIYCNFNSFRRDVLRLNRRFFLPKICRVAKRLNFSNYYSESLSYVFQIARFITYA